jgi:transposase
MMRVHPDDASRNRNQPYSHLDDAPRLAAPSFRTLLRQSLFVAERWGAAVCHKTPSYKPLHPIRVDVAVAGIMDVSNLVLDIGQIRSDARNGRLSVEQLVDIIEKQQQTIKRQAANELRLIERLTQYEPQASRETTTNQAHPKTPTASYSVDAETRRRRHRRRCRRKKSPGRQPTEVKFAATERLQDVYPDGVRRSDCQLVRERAVWRLEEGRAVRVGYRIFAATSGKEPRIPGVTPRCEYGIEILVVLAFLVYLIGISLDKACAVLGFFCQLPLSKSQANALLRQLAQHWEGEFDLLCDLIAHAAVVYMDETGWRVGDEGCSLWAFASKLHRVFLFGCHKDDATLDAMLPPDVFDGIGVSDDAAVYRDRFTQAQKCWAHLLRKAIKLALLYPSNQKYQRFLDQLLELYRDAKRSAVDGRLGKEGRQHRVAELEGRLCELLQPHTRETTPAMQPHERDFTNLVNELGRLVMAEELFTFVLEPEVAATNNCMERELRNPALERKAGRTNKTAAGAHRRSVIVSVLQSLRANLENFCLTVVLEEIGRWMKQGMSLFATQWRTMHAAEAATADTG